MSPVDKQYLAQFMASAMNGILANPDKTSVCLTDKQIVENSRSIAILMLNEHKAAIKTNNKEIQK